MRSTLVSLSLVVAVVACGGDSKGKARTAPYPINNMPIAEYRAAENCVPHLTEFKTTCGTMEIVEAVHCKHALENKTHKEQEAIATTEERQKALVDQGCPPEVATAKM